jgi:predicted transcriptional regulator YheO
VQPLQKIQEFLSNFTRVEEETIKDELELLRNMQEIAHNLIQQIIGDSNVDKMDRAKKLEIVSFMDEKGFFLIKGAIDNVAESLQVPK